MSNQNHFRPITVREVKVRANNFSFDDNNLKVSGYVNETGKPSDPIPNWGETDEIPDDEDFVEVMAPGVFEDAIRTAQQTSDFIDFYLEHDPDNYLASTREGTLQLSEDNTGLKMSAKIVPTNLGQDAYTLIKSGVIKSMSFGFVPLKAQWDLSGDTPVRTVTQIQLLEVSAVRFPAYPDSNISARKKHLKRLNAMLEKRGFTLNNIHHSKKRGVNMPKKEDTKKSTRSSGDMGSMMSSSDAQALISAIQNHAASVDNLRNAVQENSEVQKNICAQFLQSANGDRSKKETHKKTSKRDDETAKDGKTSGSGKSDKGETDKKETPKTEKPKESPKDEKTSDESEKSDPKADAERAKKAKKAKAKAEKRSKKIAKMVEGLGKMNETVK